MFDGFQEEVSCVLESDVGHMSFGVVDRQGEVWVGCKGVVYGVCILDHKVLLQVLA